MYCTVDPVDPYSFENGKVHLKKKKNFKLNLFPIQAHKPMEDKFVYEINFDTVWTWYSVEAGLLLLPNK